MDLDLRPIVLAGILVAVGAFVMLSMHDQHYRQRREKILAARISALEAILLGDH